MRWFQSPLLRLVEPVLLVSFSLWFDTMKMTFLPLPVNSPSERELFPANLSAASPHFFPVPSSPPGKPQNQLAWWSCSSHGFQLEYLLNDCLLKYGYRCFGNASGLVLTCLLCCYAPGYHALLVTNITFILRCLIVVHVGLVMFFGAWLTSVTEYS